MSDYGPEDDTSYRVDYCRQPESSRFQPGHSGNPKSKPKGKENLITAFKRIACKKIKVRIGGIMRGMTVAEATVLKYWQRAIKGDQKALYNLLPLLEEAEMVVKPSVAERMATFLGPDAQISESTREFMELLVERRELKAELRRRQRVRAEKRRREAQSDDTRDPLA